MEHTHPSLKQAVGLTAIAVSLLLFGLNGRSPDDPAPCHRPALATFGALPMTFEANRGQTDDEVRFLSRGLGYTLFLTQTEAVLSLHKEGAAAAKTESPATTLRLKLVDANTSIQPKGLDELPSRVNYLIGSNPDNWRTNVPVYPRVKYEQVYPGIDVLYHGNQREVEYDFVLAPGADPGVIELAIEGADQVEIGERGDLVMRSSGGEIRQRKPAVYQEINGVKREVSAEYALRGYARVGFEVGDYDPARPLVIDPVLTYSTYLGGNANEEGLGIALDAAGNAYVTGSTGSVNFPKVNPFQAVNLGTDVFVTKFNAAGSSLIYSTYIGGSGFDSGLDIAVSSSGEAFVTGHTASSDFPTAGAIQPLFGGGIRDAFAAKLDNSGAMLAYSTYLGGADLDEGHAIAVDSSGRAYVTGETRSLDFPTASPLQGAFGGIDVFGGDAFVARINASGSAMDYSTYLGGSAGDWGRGIAVDSLSNAYVTGTTVSTDFPTANAFQAMHGGSSFDAFVTKLDATGSTLAYSTFLGGTSSEEGMDVAVDSLGQAYVTGYTQSPNFPTFNAFQPVRLGHDAFVTKLDAAGSALVYSTFLGGSGAETGFGIAVDVFGKASVTGFTNSANFPTEAPIQPMNAGPNDAFVTRFNASGSSLAYSTYLGGSFNDEGSSVAVDGQGNAFMTGTTNSLDFPTASPFQPNLGGFPGCCSRDAYVSKISDPATIVLAADRDSFLRNGADDTNEGANERLRIQSSGHNRVVVAFDLSGISTTGLQSATLALNIAENSDNWGDGRLVDAHPLLEDWKEGNGRNAILVGGGPSDRGTGEGVTWRCAKDADISNHAGDCGNPWSGGAFGPATAAGHLHTKFLIGDVSWDVTADVLAGANFGWLIKKREEGQAGQVRYYSREGAAGNPALAPRLVLVYGP